VKLNDALQWAGAAFIIAGHVLNAAGNSVHNDTWNIVAFGLGTICFFAWTVRVANKPQMLVNVVALVTCAVGLLKAFG
jgi:hypothetical protein